MPFRKKSNEELRQILAKLESLGGTHIGGGHVLTNHMQEALHILSSLANQGTENQLDHIINYCRSRVEYALYLVEREEQENAYLLAKQTLIYYLKNSSLGKGGEAEL